MRLNSHLTSPNCSVKQMLSLPIKSNLKHILAMHNLLHAMSSVSRACNNNQLYADEKRVGSRHAENLCRWCPSLLVCFRVKSSFFVCRL